LALDQKLNTGIFGFKFFDLVPKSVPTTFLSKKSFEDYRHQK
jgi:hypothetical protein